ncbi:hypothetical protein DWB85_02450 [Seongchinamella sediminis]|uniref:Uncharacterized protein n=1 Tax=Seongchinamella sediminis TaxID=2283635 RepID=A0A3L7E1U3_9GAMM|nr:hypothetical protein [Seongchinamella sediminis]RLQ23434.1 hypothetical protein DWB85_02450 [Seongchinamella sediminis]
MHLFNRTYQQPLARVFALVALLCAGALQVQEAGHDHWNSAGDSYSQCLVCKAGTAMLPSAAPVAVPESNGSVEEPQPDPSTRAPFVAAFNARGPPAYS